MNEDQKKTFGRFTDIMDVANRPFMGIDLLRMICGEKIGEGNYRSVYEYGLNYEEYVVKVSYRIEANINEMEVWESVKDFPHRAKWFAPCIHISPGGHFLVQKKVEPVPKDHKMPRTLPQFFTDIKPSNWGLLNGRLVCKDYHFIDRTVDYSLSASRPVKWRTGKTSLSKEKGMS